MIPRMARSHHPLQTVCHLHRHLPHLSTDPYPKITDPAAPLGK
jgi:hypothetical protein